MDQQPVPPEIFLHDNADCIQNLFRVCAAYPVAARERVVVRNSRGEKAVMTAREPGFEVANAWTNTVTFFRACVYRDIMLETRDIGGLALPAPRIDLPAGLTLIPIAKGKEIHKDDALKMPRYAPHDGYLLRDEQGNVRYQPRFEIDSIYRHDADTSDLKESLRVAIYLARAEGGRNSRVALPFEGIVLPEARLFDIPGEAGPSPVDAGGCVVRENDEIILADRKIAACSFRVPTDRQAPGN